MRIPTRLNVFLDRHAVLDADYLIAAETSNRYRALLPKDGDPSNLAGRALVVFDSRDPVVIKQDMAGSTVDSSVIDVSATSRKEDSN